MNVIKILSAAWEITRRRRDLWFFGFLTAMLGSPMLVNAFLTPPMSKNALQNIPTNAMPMAGWQPPTFWRKVMLGMDSHTATYVALWFALATLAMMTIFYVLFVAGEAALFHALLADPHGEPPSLRSQWAEAHPFFWRLFFFPLPAGLLFGIAVVGLGAFAAALTLSMGALGILLLIPLFLLAFLGGWLLTIYFRLGAGAIVLEGLPFWEALDRPWRLWKQHFWVVLLMGLVLEVILWVASTVLFYITSLFMLGLSVLLEGVAPTLVPWFIAHPAILLTAGTLLMLGGKTLLAFALAPVMTWVITAWGLTYLALLGRWPAPDTAAYASAAPQNTA